MSDREGCGHRLGRELLDFEERYDKAKSDLSAGDVYRLWLVLWRLLERVRVDYRHEKEAAGKSGANTAQ
jgi:hypothetical protein